MNNKKNNHLNMKSICEDERPYERCLINGVQSLSNDELLAVLLKSGTRQLRVTELASVVLAKCEEYGGISHLADIPYDELVSIDGIGKVKAISLLCAGELAKRIRTHEASGGVRRISNVKEAATYMMEELSGLDREETWAVFLDGKNNIIRKYNISKGTANSSPLSTREIFKPGIRLGSCGVIIYHNHPSGDPSPSAEDILITKKIREAGILMDIELVDHIIIGNMNYISLKNEGIL